MAIEVKRAGVRRAQCSCSMPAIWWALSYARGALVIFHSPRSCAHVVREKDVGSFHRLIGAGTYAPPSPVPLLTSGIGEGDAVFGAAERLRACIRFAVERYQPRAVFVAGSCVSGIIGDDTRAAAEEMEEELGLPVVAVPTGGFLDDESFDGYLSVARVLMDRFMQPPARVRQGTVVFLGDYGGLYSAYVQELKRLLGGLGLQLAGQFPTYTPLDEVQAVPEAELLVVLGSAMSDEKQAMLIAFAEELHTRFGTPYFAEAFAGGAEETAHWLRCIGVRCHREAAAEETIRREEAAFERILVRARETLAGRRTVLVVGRELHWLQPEILLRLIERAGVRLSGIILLALFTEAQRREVEDGLRACCDVPILAVEDPASEELLRSADFVFTTHELVDVQLRQILLGKLPTVGWAMERQLIEDMEHVLYRHTSRGGLIYG